MLVEADLDAPDAYAAADVISGFATGTNGCVGSSDDRCAIPHHLPVVLHALAAALDQFGYIAVVGLVMAEDFGVTVPGETVLVLAAVYAPGV